MGTAPGQLAPGVLPRQEILRLCGLEGNDLAESAGTGPIQPCRRVNVRTASYDLRLGHEYHINEGSNHGLFKKMVSGLGVKVGAKGPSPEISELRPGSIEHIVLAPNQVVVVSCLERICMPEDMVGHLTLKQDVLLEGLIMASQSQIDAGYEGWIYPLLYNLTDREVTLQLNRSLIRLELVRLSEPTEPYKGDYMNRKLATSLKRPITSSLTSLKEQVEDTHDYVTRTRLFAVVGVIVLALIPFLTGFVDDLFNARERLSRVEGEIAKPLKLEDKVDRLQMQVRDLQCQLRAKEKPGSKVNC